MLIREMLLNIEIIDVYKQFGERRLGLDLQGWEDYTHPYYDSLVARIQPRQIVEVGTWKGNSAIRMARSALRFHSDVIVLCIDTWLGSNEILWRDPGFRTLLRLKHGYPNLYEQFLSNIVHEDLTETIFPLPMTSTGAAELLSACDVKADLIYIDAGHQEGEVYQDIVAYWPLLRDGGILWGDDYSLTWPGVVKAVNRFASENSLLLETSPPKFCFVK